MVAAAVRTGGVIRFPGRRRGKSGLHRAGCQITSGGGDSKDSATEINRCFAGNGESSKGGKAV